MAIYYSHLSTLPIDIHYSIYALVYVCAGGGGGGGGRLKHIGMSTLHS